MSSKQAQPPRHRLSEGTDPSSSIGNFPYKPLHLDPSTESLELKRFICSILSSTVRDILRGTSIDYKKCFSRTTHSLSYPTVRSRKFRIQETGFWISIGSISERRTPLPLLLSPLKEAVDHQRSRRSIGPTYVDNILGQTNTSENSNRSSRTRY